MQAGVALGLLASQCIALTAQHAAGELPQHSSGELTAQHAAGASVAGHSANEFTAQHAGDDHSSPTCKGREDVAAAVKVSEAAAKDIAEVLRRMSPDTVVRELALVFAKEQAGYRLSRIVEFGCNATLGRALEREAAGNHIVALVGRLLSCDGMGELFRLKRAKAFWLMDRTPSFLRPLATAVVEPVASPLVAEIVEPQAEHEMMKQAKLALEGETERRLFMKAVNQPNSSLEGADGVSCRLMKEAMATDPMRGFLDEFSKPFVVAAHGLIAAAERKDPVCETQSIADNVTEGSTIVSMVCETQTTFDAAGATVTKL
eukprot:Polyplicarium_translucidae@DN283_c0_g1_i1.p1